jgi:hypothetical protein
LLPLPCVWWCSAEAVELAKKLALNATATGASNQASAMVAAQEFRQLSLESTSAALAELNLTREEVLGMQAQPAGTDGNDAADGTVDVVDADDADQVRDSLSIPRPSGWALTSGKALSPFAHC